jgi:triosephosphate isomerase
LCHRRPTFPLIYSYKGIFNLENSRLERQLFGKSERRHAMFILVNLKAYPSDPVVVAEAAQEVRVTSDVRIAVACQAAQLHRVAATGVETWAQTISPVEPGSHTGSTLAETVAEAGATGTLLNHSEHRLKLADIDGGLRAAERAGLETVVCANNPRQIGAVTALDPDAVAVEPPELIGTGTPVSTANPEVVDKAVEAAYHINPDIPVLCGAGISTGEDLTAARRLGAQGVLLASGVAKADDPQTALTSLVNDL